MATTRVDERSYLVALTGSSSVADLREALAALAALPGARLVVDLRAACKVDASILGALVQALKRFRSSGGEVSLVSDGIEVGGLLRITGLDRVFRVLPSLEGAFTGPVPTGSGR